MIEPKLCLIPSAYKGGLSKGTLYSVLPNNGAGDFDFTRSGDATRINKEGLIETVGNNVPRLNYPLIDGVVSGCPSLLLEPQRTNLLTYSEQLDNADWDSFQSASVTANTTISPDGYQNADTITFSSDPSSLIFQVYTSTSSTFTISVYAKSSTGKKFCFRNFDGVDVIRSSDFTTTSSWQRFTFTFTSAISNVSICNEIGGNVGSIQVYGCQLEVGSYATSYIPTLGNIETRSAETCNNAGDVNTFNDSEGVLMAEISALANDETFRLITLSDGTNVNRISFYYGNASNQIRFWVVSSGTTSTLQDTSLFDVTLSIKIALKYKENDFALWINGFEVLTANSGSTPIGLDRITFAEADGTGNPFYGNTKQLQYFNTALNDTSLEELTSWRSFNEMANALQYKII